MTDDAPQAPTAVRTLVLAAFSFSLMALFARLAGERMTSFQIVFVRSLIALALTLGMLRRARRTPWGEGHKRLLVLRGVFGLGALCCFFYSVTHLPLAEATVIQFTSPIFTALIAAFWLGERTTRRLAVAILLGLAGVLLITRPGALGGDLLGGASMDGGAALPPAIVGVGLLGAVLTSIAHVMVRRLAALEHELVIIFYFPLVATPAALALAAPGWVWPTAIEWLFLLGVGIAAQGGQIYLTRGFRHVPAGSASVVLYLQIVFATVWGVLVLAERPDPWTLAGSLLVLGGTVIAARRPRLPA